MVPIDRAALTITATGMASAASQAVSDSDNLQRSINDTLRNYTVRTFLSLTRNVRWLLTRSVCYNRSLTSEMVVCTLNPAMVPTARSPSLLTVPCPWLSTPLTPPPSSTQWSRLEPPTSASSSPLTSSLVCLIFLFLSVLLLAVFLRFFSTYQLRRLRDKASSSLLLTLCSRPKLSWI